MQGADEHQVWLTPPEIRWIGDGIANLVALHMAADGPVYLRWRSGRPAPAEESFETADEALDAVAARWPLLPHQAPQLLDARRILMLSTAELGAAFAHDARSIRRRSTGAVASLKKATAEFAVAF